MADIPASTNDDADGQGNEERVVQLSERRQARNGAAPGGAEEPKRVATWRIVLGAFILVFAFLFIIVGMLAMWVRDTVLDTAGYVEIVSELAAEPQVQARVADRITTRLFATVNVEEVAKEALPERVQFLALPLANQLQEFINNQARTVLASEEFQKFWVEANTRAHPRLIGLLTNSPDDLISIQNNAVVLNTDELTTRLRARISARGIGIFDNIPPRERDDIVLYQSSQLGTAQRLVELLFGLSVALPLIALGLLALYVWIRRDTRRGILNAGICLVSATLVLWGLIFLGRNYYLDSVALAANRDLTAAIMDIIFRPLRSQFLVFLGLGLGVMAIAIAAGPTRAAVSARTKVELVTIQMMQKYRGSPSADVGEGPADRTGSA